MAKRIDADAAAWAVKQDCGTLTAEEACDLNAWLAMDVRHRGAYVRAQAVLYRAGRVSSVGGSQDDSVVMSQPASGRIGWKLYASAAALALVALVSALLFNPSVSHYERQLQTHTGEVLKVALPDGSVATLDAMTQLHVDFNEQRRLLVLDAGEALVDVAKDPGRPLIVRSGGTDVVAVGTSFSVRKLRGQEVEVLVREGIVDVRNQDLAHAGIRVRASHAAISKVGGDIRVETVPEVSISRRLAWKEGMLAFEGVPLADALQRFARYSAVRIEVKEPWIAEQRIVGMYASSDPVGFAEAVARGLDLTMQHVGVNVYQLERKKTEVRKQGADKEPQPGAEDPSTINVNKRVRG